MCHAACFPVWITNGEERQKRPETNDLDKEGRMNVTVEAVVALLVGWHNRMMKSIREEGDRMKQHLNPHEEPKKGE